MEAWRRSSKESVKRMLDYCLLMEVAKGAEEAQGKSQAAG
jgi:hypothetical protein